MTRDEAITTVRALAAGLPPEPTLDASVARLMERVAAHAHAELLRDALTEHGARAVLLGAEGTA